MTDQVPTNEALSELFQYVIDLSHDMDAYHSQKLMEIAGIIGGVIASRAPKEQLPSKDVDLPKLMAWLRERHSYLVGLGAKETYEGLIHAHIERLERRLNECGLECSEGLKRLAAENEELKRELAREVGTRDARVAEIDHLRRRAAELERELGLAVWAAGAKPARGAAQPPGDGQ